MKKFFIVIICILLSTIGCNKKNSDSLQPEGELLPQTSKASINIDLPDSYDVKSLKVVSGIHVSTNGVKNGRTSQFGFSLDLNLSKVQLISVLNSTDTPVLMCIANHNSSSNQSYIINSQTTAESLIFLHPLVATSKPEDATKILQTIRGVKSYNSLVKEIDQKIKSKTLINLESSNQLIYYKPAVQEVISAFSESTKYQSKGDISINVTNKSSNISCIVTNSGKRWMSVYVDKFSSTSNAPVKSEGFDFEKLSSIKYLRPSNQRNMWNYIEDSGKSNQETYEVQIEHERAYVKCYGIGFGNLQQFKEMQDYEYNRFVFPALFSIVYDTVLPVVDVITGLEFKSLAGRPNSKAFQVLVTKIMKPLIDSYSKPNSLAELKSQVNSNQYLEIPKKMIQEAILLIANEPKLILDVTKEVFTEISVKSLAFTGLKQIFAIVRVVNIMATSVELVKTISAYVTEDAIMSFKLYPEIDIKDGLIAYYPFNGNSNDESGNGNHGIVKGATLTIDRHGRTNKAYSFDGVNDYIQVLYNKFLLPNSDTKTYSFWLKHNATSNAFTFQNGDADYDSGQFKIYASPTQIQVLLHSHHGGGGNPTAEFMTINNPTKLNDGNFHNVTVTIDNKIVKYFIDGSLLATKKYTAPYRPFDPKFQIEIGRIYNSFTGGYSQYFNGIVDDIRIYNRALSEAEILSLYNLEK